MSRPPVGLYELLGLGVAFHQPSDWREAARLVLHFDPEHECDRARKAFDSHLSRAKWMTEHGYRHLLRRGASDSSDAGIPR
ncbi:hypothetical protein [Bradyrhizobium jicamae]|uniref:hypothetical protein n=1 Tax=Bradyrhizobium jicamae TaxID=280332 RepID=UPI003D314FF8